MKFLLIILFLISLSSCKIPLEMSGEKNNYTFKGLNFKIGDFNNIDWRVGVDRKVNISKGFFLTLYYPKLTADIIEKLNSMGVSSWIVEIYRIPPSGSKEVLTHIKVPFLNTISSYYIPFLTSRYNKVFLKFIYGAISPSTRFERFDCPAFNHNKKISDYSYEDLTPIDTTLIYPQKIYSGPAKNQDVEGFQAIEINGGMSLKGRYFFKWALYNERERTLYSDYLDSEEYLYVEIEDSVIISGCENFPIPERGKDVDPLKQFKFGN